MRFDIVTLFPGVLSSYFNESIIGRAQKEGKVDIVPHNLRDWTKDKRRTVDDIPYGGGAGMVLKVEPIYRCVRSLLGSRSASFQNKEHVRIILFSAKGKTYTQRDAERLLKYERLILICGHYEGVDERVAEHIAHEEISLGKYVLTGGEIPAMAVVDSITRLLPGVLGNEESLREESFGAFETSQEKSAFVGKDSARDVFCEYPHYTRPAMFHGWGVPEVLLSGNHREIALWRRSASKKMR